MWSFYENLNRLRWTFDPCSPNVVLLFLLQPVVLGKVRWPYNSFKISKCLPIEEPVRAPFNMFCLEVVFVANYARVVVVHQTGLNLRPGDECKFRRCHRMYDFNSTILFGLNLYFVSSSFPRNHCSVSRNMFTVLSNKQLTCKFNSIYQTLPDNYKFDWTTAFSKIALLT